MKNRITRISINQKAMLIFGTFALLLLCYSKLPFAGIYDDMVGVIYFIVIMKKIIHINVNRTNFWMSCSIIIICLLGLISNLISGVTSNIVIILLDLYSFLKLFIIYIGVSMILKNDAVTITKTVSYIAKLSRVFLIAAMIGLLLNTLGVVDLFSGIRYGIKNYCFVFGNASQFGVFVGVAFAFIVLEGKKNFLYEIFFFLLLISTVKGMSLIILCVYAVLEFFEGKKIRITHIIILASALLFVLQYQITHYLLDETAPRAILLYYGFVTAIEYFPFGAGFATYGSYMAALHYSPLYIKYGFTSRASLMFNDPSFSALNDVYIGMILGQFGIIALLLFCFVIGKMGFRLLKTNINNSKAKNMAIANFACFCGLCVMAGSVKVEPGMAIAIYLSIYNSIAALRENKGGE